MDKDYNHFDRMLIRVKDFAFLIGIVGAFLVWSGNWASFPSRLEANEKEIDGIRDWEQKTDNRLTVMEQDIKYIVKSLDSMSEKP